jgi:hypothetical protein
MPLGDEMPLIGAELVRRLDQEPKSGSDEEMTEDRGLNVVVRYGGEAFGPYKAGDSLTAGRGNGETITFDEASDAVSRSAVKLEVHSDRVVLLNTSAERPVAYQDGGGPIRDLFPGPGDTHSFRDDGRVMVPDSGDGKDFVLSVEFDALPIDEVHAVDGPAGGSGERLTRNPDQKAWDEMPRHCKTALVGLVATHFVGDLEFVDFPHAKISSRRTPGYRELGNLIGTGQAQANRSVFRAAIYLSPRSGDDKNYHVGLEKMARGQLVGRDFQGPRRAEKLVHWVLGADLVTEEDVRNLPGFAQFRCRSDND